MGDCSDVTRWRMRSCLVSRKENDRSSSREPSGFDLLCSLKFKRIHRKAKDLYFMQMPTHASIIGIRRMPAYSAHSLSLSDYIPNNSTMDHWFQR